MTEFLRPTLDDAPFVLGNRTESTAAKTAAHDIDREADHFPGRDLRLTVSRVRPTGVGQFIDTVEFFGGQRNRRLIQPDITLAMRLDQGACIAGVRFKVEGARGMGIEHRIVFDLLVGWQADHGMRPTLATPRQTLFARHNAHGLLAGLCCCGRRAVLAGFHGIRIGMTDQRPRRIDRA